MNAHGGPSLLRAYGLRFDRKQQDVGTVLDGGVKQGSAPKFDGRCRAQGPQGSEQAGDDIAANLGAEFLDARLDLFRHRGRNLLGKDLERSGEGLAEVLA